MSRPQSVFPHASGLNRSLEIVGRNGAGQLIMEVRLEEPLDAAWLRLNKTDAHALQDRLNELYPNNVPKGDDR